MPSAEECILSLTGQPKKNLYRETKTIPSSEVEEYFSRFKDPQYTEVMGWLTYSVAFPGAVDAHILCEREWK